MSDEAPTYFEHPSRALIIKVDQTRVYSCETTSDEYGLRTSLTSFTIAEADRFRPGWRDDFTPITKSDYDARIAAIVADAE